MAQSTLLNNSLIEAGYDSQLVWTKNCPTTKEYISKNSRPSIFLYSDSRYVKDPRKSKGKCEFKISDESFATLWNVKLHAFCVRSDSGFTDLTSFLKGKSRVTVAATNSLAGEPFKQLQEQTGVEFKHVEYNGLKRTIAGLLAGDTDLMYQQYTATQAGSDEIKCFAVSGDKEINGMQPMTELFPDWELNRWNSYQYAHAVNMTVDQVKAAGEIIKDVQESDAKLKAYLDKGFMMSARAAEEAGIGKEDYLASTELLRSMKK
jgi:tripartite-type tricarboxylate transporter receptor subunit TctC